MMGWIGRLLEGRKRENAFIHGVFGNAVGSRTYKLFVPSSYRGRPAPLVVMLHGCTQDPDDFARGTRMNALAEEHGCLVLYPAQSDLANPQRCWNWFSAMDQRRGEGEPAILEGMTREIMSRHAVDGRKVYVAGMSAGGAMAVILGTLYPELFAAVGVHSGLPFASADDLPSALAAMKGMSLRPRQPGASQPVIVFHGEDDKVVHPVNAEEVIAQAMRGELAQAVEPGQVPAGRTYTRTVHRDASGTAVAERWLVHGAGHAWSGGSPDGSFTDTLGPDASREMLRFFATRRG